MKKLVWLLVLINVGLLAYFNKDVILPSAPKAAMVAIQPDKISILTQPQVDALPSKGSAPAAPTSAAAAITPPTVDATVVTNVASVASPANSACYEWGVFSAANLTGAQSAVSNLSLKATVKEQSSLEAKRFWVYKPPLKSAEAAQAKALELKTLGVNELYVVQEAKWKNAISFGVFEDEQLATNLLNELRAKGVKEVVKSLRNQGKGHASLQFSKLTDAEMLAIRKLKPDFPEANIKEVTCN
jgi:hypothetical protein